jgi:hypothetical protein
MQLFQWVLSLEGKFRRENLVGGTIVLATAVSAGTSSHPYHPALIILHFLHPLVGRS